jgi:hypothetical protein
LHLLLEPEMPASADLILLNGRLRTLDAARPSAEALAIRGDRLVYVGDSNTTQAWIGPGTQVIDLQGRLALPGFFDSHCHADSGADQLFCVNLYGLESPQAIRETIHEYLLAHPRLTALRGIGWLPPAFPPQGPTRQFLDELTPNIPAVLYSQDYHSAWLNTRALELAGITAESLAPPGGVIEREPSGFPSGTLREAAMDLAEPEDRPPVIPPFSVEQLIEGLKYFQAQAHSYGLTAVHIPHLSRERRELQALLQMEAEGSLALRVIVGLLVEPHNNTTVVEELSAIRQAVNQRSLAPGANRLVSIQTAKLFMDGVIEGATAYLEEPYLQPPQAYNQPMWEPKPYNDLCAALEQAGFQIHVHAIGDAAVRMALDGFENARQVNGLNPASQPPRHGITHLQLVAPQDITRFARLGAVAFPQPYWFVRDSFYDLAQKYLGRERADRQYPLKSFFDQGVLVASASDYPVTIPPRPLDGIASGVTRALPGERRPERSLPPARERASLAQMVESFTLNGARAFGLDGLIGSLQAGKRADLTVLDRDIFTLPPDEIHTAQVIMTIFNGKVVYSTTDSAC